MTLTIPIARRFGLYAIFEVDGVGRGLGKGKRTLLYAEPIDLSARRVGPMKRLVLFFTGALLLSCSEKTKVVNSEPVRAIDNNAERRRETLALAALYRATDAPTWWRNDTNWLNYEVPLGEWYGVETDPQGRIIGLKLNGNNLRYSIPHELGWLTNLEVLDLGDNRLEGSIPPELGRLVNLENLDLSTNKLTSIPSELGQLIHLENLNLSGNTLGSIPSELGQLINLEVLNLSNIQLTSIPINDLAKLANLKELKLEGNQLTGSIPPELRPANPLGKAGAP